MAKDTQNLAELTRLIRYYILLASTTAGSGHPTSSLSAVELTATLFFNYLQYDLDNPQNPNNDHVIFSKGHASPLFYALYAAAGKITEAELLKYRTFDSVLEGHPTPRFPFTEVPTGSLGQGLSVGVGMALALRMQGERKKGKGKSTIKLYTNEKTLPFTLYPKPYVYVLLGDGEMAEGSVWEAIQSASYYKLDNLIGILDVNGLGQSEPTMLKTDIDTFADRISSFGWHTLTVEDGHDLEEVDTAFAETAKNASAPTMIIAKTEKGHGIPFFAGKDGWHGKPLPKEELEKAIQGLGKFDKNIRGTIKKPHNAPSPTLVKMGNGGVMSPRNDELITAYKPEDSIPTRQAYGKALVKLGKVYPDVVVLDGDVKNSTYAEYFEKDFDSRFFQLFIAEQNMVGVATGLAKRGKRPYVATFSSFLPRAADQIRMASYAGVNVVFCGSHAGVSIGEDGPSQMGLEDLSLFRTILGSTVFYPADGVSTEKLTALAYKNTGITYIRASRPATPILYKNDAEFRVGGSETFSSKFEVQSSKKKVTLVAAGITLFEALKAQKELEKEHIAVRVIDCYSIKPIDTATLQKAASETTAIITIEDHNLQGGLGDAVLEALAEYKTAPIYKLGVAKMPRSGKPAQLMDYEGISAQMIIKKVREIFS